MSTFSLPVPEHRTGASKHTINALYHIERVPYPHLHFPSSALSVPMGVNLTHCLLTKQKLEAGQWITLNDTAHTLSPVDNPSFIPSYIGHTALLFVMEISDFLRSLF